MAKESALVPGCRLVMGFVYRCSADPCPIRERYLAEEAAAPRVRVIPATRQVEPGKICETARRWKISIIRGGIKGEWDAYYWEHPVLGASDPVFESAEDCAQDGMEQLARAVATDAGLRGPIQPAAYP